MLEAPPNGSAANGMLGAAFAGLALREAREMFEREYLVAQINRFGGNISRTANFVGMERSALHRKLKSLNVIAAGRSERDRGGGGARLSPAAAALVPAALPPAGGAVSCAGRLPWRSASVSGWRSWPSRCRTIAVPDPGEAPRARSPIASSQAAIRYCGICAALRAQGPTRKAQVSGADLGQERRRREMLVRRPAAAGAARSARC